MTSREILIDSFNWILPQLLAGSGRPGLIGELDVELEWLGSVGICHIVSLTRERLEVPPEATFKIHHFPIFDMGIPTPRRTAALCLRILEDLERSEPVLLHCKAGLGRTGTILACCLVSRGTSAGDAIEEVRRVSHFYIQNSTQERFIHHYAEFLDEQEPGGKPVA